MKRTSAGPWAAVLVAAALLAGCDTGTTGVTNTAPDINNVATDVPPPYFTNPGPFDWIQLSMDVSDRDGDLIEVTWSASSGVFQNDDVTGRDALWQPGSDAGDHVITVTASDGMDQAEQSITASTWVSLRGCWSQSSLPSQDPAYNTVTVDVGSDMRDDQVAMTVMFQAASEEATRSSATNSTYDYPDLQLSAEGDGSPESPVSATLAFSTADGSTLSGTVTVARGDDYSVELQRVSDQVCP